MPTTRKPSSSSSRSSSSRPTARGEPTTAKQQKIQREQDSKDKAKNAERKSESAPKKKAVQAGAQDYPEPPLPSQHLRKPGLEAEMELKPQFMAPSYKGSGKLEGLTALITGADSGIGRAVAVLFAREGADVAVAYLSSKEDAEETRRCIEAEGRRCVLIAGDVKDAAFCKDAVKKTVKSLGKLDILVNNAAFQEHADSLEDLTEERFDETLRTNVYGYFHMAKAALPHLKKGSCIINTGSVTGLEGSAKLLDYSATKGAIHAFTKSLASNLIDKGIRVNAVAPGVVPTEMSSFAKTEQGRDFTLGMQALKRMAEPEDIADAIAFLASEQARWINGETVHVDGGSKL
jgi:NAD(P)-dependent dehydrogenase (short-subunit alcohol dehydrogenase family)